MNFFATLSFHFLLCVVLQTSYSQTPCCYVDKWQGVLSMSSGLYDLPANYASLVSVTSRVSVDGAAGKVFNNMAVTNNSHVTYLSVLDDYTSGHSYTVIDGQCYKGVPGEKNTLSCVPKNATYLGSHSFGGVATDTWLVPAPGNKSTGYTTTRVTVTKANCAPLQTFSLTFGDKSTMNLATMQNLTQGISDPSVFNVPESCKRSPIKTIADLVRNKTKGLTDPIVSILNI